MRSHKVRKLKDAATKRLSMDQLCNNENRFNTARIDYLMSKINLPVGEVFKGITIRYRGYNYYGAPNKAVIGIPYHFSIKGRARQMNVISIRSYKKIKGVYNEI